MCTTYKHNDTPAGTLLEPILRRYSRHQCSSFLYTITILILLSLSGCGPRALDPDTKEAIQPSKPTEVSLHTAAMQGNIDAIQQHIEAGSDLNEKDANGSTPLIVAATFGQTDAARALIDAGADLASRDKAGSTPLHIAAFFCHQEIVKALLDKGANKYFRNNVGNTPLGSVAAPFDDVKGIYDSVAEALGPLGLKLDYERIRSTRPEIAEMLRPRTEELEVIDYTPLADKDWKLSTPEQQGLDPTHVAEFYLEAAELSSLNGLLIIKNGHLIAEAYFNQGAIEQKNSLQSVTKSYISALVGIALDQGCLSSLDQKMIDFFPEFAEQINDPRKKQITIRNLLQMSGGYPGEERDPPYLEKLYADNAWLPHLIDFPLTYDPGTEFWYSNLTSHILGVIVARACDTDLKSFGQKHLFSPINAEVGEWKQDADKYHYGHSEISFTARDMAKFGLLYLRQGEYEGNRVLPADWVSDSLQSYFEGMFDNQWRDETSHYLGPYFRDLGYGYQWWSARVGEHHFDFAWGHGGNLIILLEGLNMIIVTTANPLDGMDLKEVWKHEGAIINLVGKFIRSLTSA